MSVYTTTFNGHTYTLEGDGTAEELASLVESYLPNAPVCAFCKIVLFPGTAICSYRGEMAHACHAPSASEISGYLTADGEIDRIENYLTFTSRSHVGSVLRIPASRTDQYPFREVVNK
jgi:hypothetical protein